MDVYYCWDVVELSFCLRDGVDCRYVCTWTVLNSGGLIINGFPSFGIFVAQWGLGNLIFHDHERNLSFSREVSLFYLRNPQFVKSWSSLNVKCPDIKTW